MKKHLKWQPGPAVTTHRFKSTAKKMLVGGLPALYLPGQDEDANVLLMRIPFQMLGLQFRQLVFVLIPSTDILEIWSMAPDIPKIVQGSAYFMRSNEPDDNMGFWVHEPSQPTDNTVYLTSAEGETLDTRLGSHTFAHYVLTDPKVRRWINRRMEL